jgi:triacylglycerol lipase
MVPGFVGFDALGQLRYCTGVTRLFDRQGVEGALLYFGNYPRASATNRALRLRKFLAKMFARGETAYDDELTLLGHSTGGLEIRKLLQELSDDGETAVDGQVPVPHAKMKRTIKRVVFMSVPHYGTNIADYAQTFQALPPFIPGGPPARSGQDRRGKVTSPGPGRVAFVCAKESLDRWKGEARVS